MTLWVEKMHGKEAFSLVKFIISDYQLRKQSVN